MTEKHCRAAEVVKDSISLAAYDMDSHNCQRIVKNGRVENEGDVQVPPMKPYPISYRAIVPPAGECERSVPNRNAAPRPCLARRSQNSGARQEISGES